MEMETTNKRHECINMSNKKRASIEEWYSIREIIIDAHISHYGEAIGYVEYVEEGDFWVAHCDEYATVVQYCPFCGVELKDNK